MLLGLQKELIVEAFMRQDPDVKVDGEWVVASIEGFMDPVRVPLKEIERKSRERGHGGYRRLSVRKGSVEREQERHPVPRGIEDHSPLDLADTLVMSLWIVRPQHCPSFAFQCHNS